MAAPGDLAVALCAFAPHNSNMTEEHHFSIRLEPDRVRLGRYYWALFKGNQAYNRSQLSFASKRQAAVEGAKVLEKRIAAWQAALTKIAGAKIAGA